MRSFSPLTALQALWQMRVKGRPFVLSHAVSARCNLRCRFCEYWKQPGKEMSTPQVFAMLDEAHGFGIAVYNAWTVEPLLREDLPAILHHARDLGMTTSLITNGLLLQKRAGELSDLDMLSVSVDGIKSYPGLRGVALEGILKGIRAAQQAGHEVLMNCVISAANFRELEDLVALAESMGCWVSFEPINLKESPDCGSLAIRQADYSAYERAIERLIELKRGGSPIINSETYLRMVKGREPCFRCHAADIILHVACEGSIEGCRVHKQPLGNVSQGIERVWEQSRQRRREMMEECEGCLFFGYVENSLLYDFVPEVMRHYEWM